MLSKSSKIFLVFLTFVLLSPLSYSQNEGKSYVIAGVTVEGNRFADAQTVITLSGLQVGDQLNLPGDNKLNLALKNLWQRKQFSDASIVVDKITPLGIFLIIKVKEFPRMDSLEIVGNKELDNEAVKKAFAKNRGDILSPYELSLAVKRLKAAYNEKGYMFPQIETTVTEPDSSNYAKLTLDIDDGYEYHVTSIHFEGNKAFTNSELEDAFEKTHTKKWWQFWRSSKFDLKEYEKDSVNLINFYKKHGFRDIEVLGTKFTYNDKEGEIAINVKVNEGNRLFVRNITFQGNAIFPSSLLLKHLDFKRGDPYDSERFLQNLKGNPEQTEASSVYLDNGYLMAQMQPEEIRVPPDSVDIIVNVTEGDRVTIRKVEIVGNTKTQDRVIRRELYTRPGDYFNKTAVIRSLKALGVLNYFNPEALQPDVKQVDKTKVDLVYKVEERSTDTFNASVGFAGTFGLTGSIGFTFNNFSLLEPLQGGAGQLFNFNWEFGQANQYQSFSLGFTEPWLFDEPTTIGFNVYDTRYNLPNLDLRRTGAQLNVGRRFHWPDDYWRGDWSIRYQLNNIGNADGTYYRPGEHTEITLSQSFSRVSLDNLFLPTSGSRFIFSNDFAMGALGIGTVDYFKSQLKYEVNSPLLEVDGHPKVILYLSTFMGYITGFKSDTTIDPIELFYMGGNGLSGFGVTPLRGYPDRSIGPTLGGEVLSKNVAELRFAVSQDPMPIYLYGFAEAGNVWQDFKTLDPFSLKRSAGVGIQLMINPIGVIGFSYGYGFDKRDDNGSVSGWQFLFNLGNQ